MTNIALGSIGSESIGEAHSNLQIFGGRVSIVYKFGTSSKTTINFICADKDSAPSLAHGGTINGLK